MFTELCLVTFGLFIVYWIAHIIYSKFIATIKKDNSNKQIQATTIVKQIHTQQLQQQQQANTKQQFKINLLKSPQLQSKLTATTITTISSIDSSKIPQDLYDPQKTTQQKNQQIYVPKLKVNPSLEYQNIKNQLSNASAMNQLNVAMIQHKIQDQFKQQINNQIQNQGQVNPADKIQQFSGLFSTINRQVEVNNLAIITNIQNHKQSDLGNEQQCSLLLHKSYERRQQRSQLELIEQLTTQKIPQKTQHTDLQFIPQIQKKQPQNDPIQRLIQQIDQLFLNNQEQFIKIINKYKVNQAQYTNNTNEQQHRNEGEKIQKLENQLVYKNQEIDIMQIQIDKYKTTNNQIQIQLFSYKNTIKQLHQTIKLLQSQNQNLQQNYQTLKNTICPQPQIQAQNISQLIQQQHANKNTVYINILQQQVTQKQNQIDKLKQQLLFQQQQIQKLHHNILQINNINNQNQKLCKDKQHQIQIKNQIIEKFKKQIQDSNLKMIEYQKELQKNKDNYKQDDKEKEKEQINQQLYIIKLNQFEKQIHKIRQQAVQQKNKYQQALKNSRSIRQQIQQKLDFVKQAQYNYIPVITRQNLIKTHTSQQITLQNKTQRSTIDLQKINQNLKNQIQFAQTQIRMFEQSQFLYLKKINQMQQHMQAVQYQNKKQINQLSSKITRLQPVTNQFQIIQKRYFQLKLKYDKLLLQKSKANKSGSNNTSTSHVNIDKKQQLVTSIVHKYSPSNSHKISVYNPDSPINNFSNESKSSSIGHYKFLSDCAFIHLQHRQFLYKTFENQLKGVIRTQKLYDSKTNKSKNPHELIDNIRNILIIIHLQNDRIIGAYTQQSFSATYPQSTKDNLAFIIDITNHRYFINKTGFNSTNYNAKSLTWGFNQIMIKYQQMDILYTNFCRDHNIYWDGRYRIQDFIGVDKQWARINQYEIFRVSKI